MPHSIVIRDVLERLTADVGPIDPTVDKLDPGDPDAAVKGIVTAFAATWHVVERAIALGANLIVSHEGIFFSHRGKEEWLKHDPVYREKAKLLQDAGIAVFRYHDYAHRRQPDGITEGLIEALGWQAYVEKQLPAAAILEIPPMHAQEAAEYAKTRLGIPYVRVAGDLAALCKRVGVLVGYRGGGATAIPLFENERLDLIVAGEGPEWETPEYVRDAARQGRGKALVMLGHAESEAPGMKALAGRLAAAFPELPVHFVEDLPVFRII